MININSNTTIYRPIKQVFDFVCTPENDFQWQYGTLSSSRLSGNNGDIGSFFQSIGHLMGRRNLSTSEITEYEAGKNYEFKSLSGLLNSLTNYSFKIDQGGTRVNISIQASIGTAVPEEFNEAALEKNLKKQIKEDLRLLKQLLEERSAKADHSLLAN